MTKSSPSPTRTPMKPDGCWAGRKGCWWASPPALPPGRPSSWPSGRKTPGKPSWSSCRTPGTGISPRLCLGRNKERYHRHQQRGGARSLAALIGFKPKSVFAKLWVSCQQQHLPTNEIPTASFPNPFLSIFRVLVKNKYLIFLSGIFIYSKNCCPISSHIKSRPTISLT